MKRIFQLALAAIVIAGCCNGKDSQHFKKAADFGRLDSEIEKMILEIRDASMVSQMNSIMVLKDGEILAEYYDNCFGPDFRNICWSASKTFTSTAVGLAVEDGLLTLDTKVVDLLDPSEMPEEVSDTLAAIDVYNLLRMSSGIKTEAQMSEYYTDKTCIKDVLSRGFDFYPGDHFRYNTFNTYLLSVLVTKVTGKTVKEYLSERIFEPMGIRNYQWAESAEGYTLGGFGMYITTEGLAKMGQLYLQGGEWKGKQLISADWIKQAMSAQIYQRGECDLTSDTRCGYGYQMWCNTVGGGARFDGAWGQWSIICPEKNAVIVMTQHIDRTSVALTAIWNYIYNNI